MKSRISTLAGFFLAFLFAISGQPGARAQVFVGDANGGPGIVNDYTLSGSAIDTPFVVPGYNGVDDITISGSLLFTIDSYDGRVASFNVITGTTVNSNLITIARFGTTGIAAGNNMIYVADGGMLTAYSETATPTVVWSDSGIGAVKAVVSGTDLYVLSNTSGNNNGNSISKYNALTGSFEAGPLANNLYDTFGLAISGSNLYVSSYGGGTIGEYTTSGSVVSGSLVTGTPDGSKGMAVNNNILYVAAISEVNMYNATTGGYLGTFSKGMSQANSVAIVSDVSPYYFLTKTAQYLQSSTAAPVLLTGTGLKSPYLLQSTLDANNLMFLTSGSMTPPAGSAGGVVNYQLQTDGSGDLGLSVPYASAGALGTAYLDGTYNITVTGSSGTNTPALSLTGSFSPNVPKLTNTSWTSGTLQISPLASTITWNALPDATASDVIYLQVANKVTGRLAYTNVLSGTSTSITLPTLSGGAYSVKLDYIKSSDADNSDIRSSVGYAGYDNRLEFTISELSEILWRNYATGADSFWLMSGTNFVSSVTLPSQTNLTWQTVGAADFTGDGTPDILWRNTTSGQYLIWLMSGTNVVTSATLPAQTGTNWVVAGAADFTGGGTADILWHNTSTGQNQIWIMSGTTYVSTVNLPTVANLAWQPVGTGKFNGPANSPDILWRNSTTGQNEIWLMSGTTFSSSVLIPTVGNTAWTVSGAADFNGDGNADILWRNSSTGQNEIWFMTGTTFTSSVLINTVASPAWKSKTVP